MTDLHYAVRMAAKNRGVTIVAVGLVAIGIGSGTALFSAFESIWLRPLPVRHPEELVRMVQKVPRLGTRSNFPYVYYRALREQSTTLAEVFGEAVWPVAMNEPAPAEQVQTHFVTPEYFEVLGAHALWGRILRRDDSQESPAAAPAVLSYGFWRRRFNGKSDAVGQRIVLHGQAFTIVGIMPREFNGISVDNTPDVHVPLRSVAVLGRSPDESKMEAVSLELAGRLRPAVSRERAQAECIAIWRPTIEAWYSQRADFGPQYAQAQLERGMELDSLERGLSILREKFGDTLRLLNVLIGLLLLMVCANVSGLLLARAASRRSEIAVRLALGATRDRLVRQMLTESLLLVVVGNAGGWLLAWLFAPLLIRALPPIRDVSTTHLALSLNVAPDWRVILVSLAATFLTAGLVGVVPAVSACRTQVDGVLRGVRSTKGWGGRKALVIVQVALCTLLLVGASLLVKTFQQLQRTEPGFDRDHIVTFTVDPNLAGYTSAQDKAFWLTFTAQVRELPGVASVAAASILSVAKSSSHAKSISYVALLRTLRSNVKRLALTL